MSNRIIRSFAAGIVLLGGIACASAVADSYPPEWILPAPDGTTVSAFLGENGADQTGCRVSRAGDVNADGIEDFVIGSYGADNAAGRAYVVFGQRGRIPAELYPELLDGSNGFALHGVSRWDVAGALVSEAGDVNGDGIDDLLVGANGAGPGVVTGPGECYVVFGRSTAFAPSIDLASLDGSNGFVLRGKNEVDQCGAHASRAGDINGDGFDDIVIGATEADPAGRSNAGECYVVFGTDAGFPALIEASTLDGTNGFAIPGEAAENFLGSGVAAAGDVNADGLDDLIIMAFGVRPAGNPPNGAAYVLFGRSGSYSPVFDLATLDGNNGFVVAGRQDIDRLYGPVAGSGDLNDDGINDLVIATTVLNEPGMHDDELGAYVIFGSDAGFAPAFDVTTLDGSNGFRLHASFDDQPYAVNAVSFDGDIDDDGIDDLVAGSFSSTADESAFVVFGTQAAFSAVVSTSNLDGENGFVLRERDPGSGFGSTLSLGDFNDDEVDDILIGAQFAEGRGDFSSGEAYVVYGRPDCRHGKVNASNGIILNTLFINGSMGGADRTVELTPDDFVGITVLRPIAGGSGRFVFHADEGEAGSVLASPLAFDIGATCFPFLLTDGGSPAIVANKFGKTNIIGSSNFYGVPLPDPELATTTYTYPPLPLGLVLTFQGVVADPGSFSRKRASTTNAVTLKIID